MQNKGQWDSRALFHVSTFNMDYWIVRNGAVYDFKSVEGGKQKRHSVQMSFVGGNTHASTIGLDKNAVINQFITGQNVTEAASFGRVTSKDVYPGIDALHYFHEKGGVRYDLIARPGSDPNKIRMRFAGANGVRVDKKGDLRLKTSLGEVGLGGLFVYQVVDGARKPVKAQFAVLGKNEAGFKIGEYDHSKPLVIDPLVYGSYFGGDLGADKVTGVVSEPDGAIYMTGWTETSAYPVIQGAYQTKYQGNRDAFITRFRGDAYTVEYNSFLGGSGRDEGLFIATDPTGASLYVLGKTTSNNLLNPLPANVKSLALQPNKKNGTDLFLFRFDKVNGTSLKPAYGSYFAPSIGNFLQDPTGFAVAPSGLILVAGTVDGEMPKAKNSVNDGNIFITAFSTRGRSIRYSRYFGKGFADVKGLAVDRNGGMFLAGSAVEGFPLYGKTFPGGALIKDVDAYLAKFDAETGNPLYSAVIGGSQADFGYGIAADQDGNAFVLGFSNSFDYPRTQGTYGQIMRRQVTVTKVRGDGTQIISSASLNTNDGAIRQDLPEIVIPVGVAVDGAGNVAVTGRIRAIPQFTLPGPTEPPNPNVPLSAISGSVQVTQNEDPNAPNFSEDYAAKPTYQWIGGNAQNRVPTYDGWINVLDGNLSSLIYGSYIGGNQDEEIQPPYADLNGDIWIFGSIDTTLGYVVPSRPPTGGGTPPDNLRLTFDGGFYEDLSNPQRIRRFITPLAFKAIPELFVGTPYGGGNLGGITGLYDYTVRHFGDPPGVPYPFSDPPRVPYSTRSDGFVSRFRFGAPTIANVSVSPNVVPGGLGATSTVTVTLSQAAPAQGAEIRLDLSSIDFAQFQGSTNPSTVILRIAGGQTQAQAVVETKAVTAPQTVTVTANYRGNVNTNTITIVPWLTQLSVTPNQTRGGFRTTGTITLAANAPAEGVTVALTSNNPNVIAVPATVTVPSGQRTFNFDLETQVVTTTTPVVLKATLLGVTRQATVTVDPFLFTIQPITFAPNTIDSGATSTGTVTINVTAPDSGLRLNLVSDNPAVTVPSTITIDPGATTATFTARGGTPKVDTTATVTASFQSISNSGQLTVRAVQFTVTLNPDTIIGGQGSVDGTITLENNAVASQDLTFNLRSENTNAATVSPAQVTIPAGSSSATFTVTPKAAATQSTVRIFARLDDLRESSATLTILGVRLASFSIAPTSMRSTIVSTGTVTLEAPAPAGGVVVTLDANTSLYQIFPAGGQIVVPAGQTTATFSIKPKRFSLRLQDTITASAGGVSKSVVVTIQP